MMKLLPTAFLIILSIISSRAQTAPGDASATGALPAPASQLGAQLPLGGYLVVYPQAPITMIRFDPSSSDIAKKEDAKGIGTVKVEASATAKRGGAFAISYGGTSFNHDGTAFDGFVRPTSSESYNNNVVDSAQRDRNVSQYKKNVKSGKWRGFVNGE
jgi:hypothetical protein